MVFFAWCGGDLPCGGQPEAAVVNRSTTLSEYKVELAVTCRGMGGAAGYHTSVLVNGHEFYFNYLGIVCGKRVESHGKDCQIIQMGRSCHSGADMRKFLSCFFEAGTYDILRKNCNSFSDAAIYFLLGRRLSWGFRVAEQVGRVADDGLGLVQALYGPAYGPNPLSEDFDVELVIDAIRVQWSLDHSESSSSERSSERAFDDEGGSTTASEHDTSPWIFNSDVSGIFGDTKRADRRRAERHSRTSTLLLSPGPRLPARKPAV